jgi:hypothetical protein
MSNGEDPGAELLFVALERAQPCEDSEEGLAGEVVGFGRALQAQVACDGRCDVGIETLESPRRARARRVEDLVEPFSDRQSEPSPRVTAVIGGVARKGTAARDW